MAAVGAGRAQTARSRHASANRKALIVEGGHPNTQLWVLRDGALDLLRRDNLVTVMTSGELLGYASLLTRTAPAFTVRARVDCTLYCIPGDLGLELLSREDGVRWLATTQRDALLYAARSLSPSTSPTTLQWSPPGATPMTRRCSTSCVKSCRAALWWACPARPSTMAVLASTASLSRCPPPLSDRR